MVDNIFEDNYAPYGPNYASYAVKIVAQGTTQNKIFLTDVGSGIMYEHTIYLSVVDNDGQVMNQENDSSLKILQTPGSSISGSNNVKLVNGTATFTDLVFVSSPGQQNVTFNVVSPLINKDQIKYGVGLDSYNEAEYDNHLDVSFRHCKPGEIIEGNICRLCSYGSYSLSWNSTSWSNCIENAKCLGGAQIQLDSGYWRKTTNSTTLIKWINDKACIGGYNPDSEYPVECKTGYKGPLWAFCDIVDGHKFQHLSYSEWMKCPEPYLNTIRVIGLLTLAIVFLGCLIIVNIRKKDENQFSVLLRIFTNYLQLTSLSLSLGTGIPPSFADIFEDANQVSSPDSAFMSFDCFTEDYQIKGFAPSNMMFKEFLILLLPLALIWGTSIVLICYKFIILMINHERKTHLKRYIVVSIICIIFLLHPNLTLSSLSMFQCIKVDDGDYRMRNYMNYQWYSGKHLGWAFAIGLPNLIVWVITLPVLGLVNLARNRKDLNEYRMRKYLLLLYQGYRPETFYWEFVNKARNFLILVWIIMFSQASLAYQVLLCLVIVLVFLRMQIRMKPYKSEENNKIEIMSVIASTFTFSCLILPNFGRDLPALRIILILLMLYVNIRFLLKWAYLFMQSWHIKNEKFNSFLTLFGYLICHKKTMENIDTSESSKVKGETRHRKMKRIVKSKKKIVIKKEEQFSGSRDKFNDYSIDVAANISIDMPVGHNRSIPGSLFDKFLNLHRSDISSSRPLEEETKVKVFNDEFSHLS